MGWVVGVRGGKLDKRRRMELISKRKRKEKRREERDYLAYHD